MKTRLLLFLTLALSSMMLISCAGTGTTAVVGPPPGPYYGGAYYGPYARPFYGRPYRPYYPARRVVVRERPVKVIVPPRGGNYVTPTRGRGRNYVNPPRPSRTDNYNVRPHRGTRVR